MALRTPAERERDAGVTVEQDSGRGCIRWTRRRSSGVGPSDRLLVVDTETDDLGDRVHLRTAVHEPSAGTPLAGLNVGITPRSPVEVDCLAI
ncbi:hypothetical protein [Haladaptatus halobius]|uniref:hypothetical protein n=1 Tax=Haladaptatus halobius TaxID=2884875 RepID=UPI001D09A91B|nr:hypothetical protein [Haladaptatus halobius]